MKIFVLKRPGRTEGIYDDFWVIGVFSTEELAKKWVQEHKNIASYHVTLEIYELDNPKILGTLTEHETIEL